MMRLPIKPTTLAVVMAALTVAGCTTFDNAREINASIQKEQSDAQHQIATTLAQPGAAQGNVHIMQHQWVSLVPLRVPATEIDPALRCDITVSNSAPVSILDVGQIVTKYCGIPVRVTSDALSAIDNPTGGNAQSNTGSGGNTANTTPGYVPAIQPFMQNTGTAPASSRLIDLNYRGTLVGLLNMVTARFGLSWKLSGGTIKIFNVDTETFYLDTLASDTSMRSVMQSGTTMVNGASGGTSGSSASGGDNGGIGGASQTNQNTTVTLKTSVWGDIKGTLDSMISPKGRVAISPSTGAVIVTDNADVLDRVKQYIAQENVSLTKQVLFNVKIISVAVTDTDSLGISWNLVYQTLGSKFGFKLDNAFAGADGATSGNFSILKDSGSKWSGSSAVIAALSEQGKVSIVKSPTASTLNLQPVAIQVARQDGYVASTSTTTTAQVGTTTALQTGMITTGFNMSLLPYVMQDNRMLLQFSVNLSNLRKLRTVTSKSGDAMAELPEIDLPINSTQKVRLAPGDTLMLTGFDQEDQSTTDSGALTPKNWLFGGGMNTVRTKSTLVVLITPTIMN